MKYAQSGPGPTAPEADTRRRARRLTVLVDDRGTVSVFMAVLAVAILAAVGLVVDGGRRIAAVREANAIAQNAARSASQEIDVDRARSDGRPVINQSAARAKADQYCDRPAIVSTGASCRWIEVDGPLADTVVEIEVTITPQGFLVPSRPVTATGRAVVADGPGQPG